jgi:hypothetical protein
LVYILCDSIYLVYLADQEEPIEAARYFTPRETPRDVVYVHLTGLFYTYPRPRVDDNMANEG